MRQLRKTGKVLAILNPYPLLLGAGYSIVLFADTTSIVPSFFQEAAGFEVALFAVVLAVFLLIFFVAIRYRLESDNDWLPTVSVLVPAKNEEARIYETLSHIAASIYPSEKLEIIAINDGSTDGTAAEIERFVAERQDITFLNFDQNRGKRPALHSGIEASTGDVVVFLDSDTFVEPEALRVLVQSLDDETDAVCGEVLVKNRDRNLVTRIQEFDYFISFNFFKAFESRFGVVTCSPGCFSACRRSSLLRVLPEWDDQMVLGVPCSYGEDRYLTSLMLKQGVVKYQRAARAATFVPETLPALFRQRLRWCRSWFVNSLLVGRYIFRRHILASATFYFIFLSTLLVPIWLFDTIFLNPEFLALPLSFLVALGSLQLIVSLSMKRVKTTVRSPWYFACYFFFLAWLVPLAIVSITDNRWGSRGKTDHQDRRVAYCPCGPPSFSISLRSR